ncbi:hypothetical protein CI109_107245 [Kwoniella shandongensis]|uniref:Uncharacterized protein n=1 Tax=Kwoniella shandongensis TaxID=1734106 RepID=A0A5M6C237_9TREE|nr:uncharacterized protein CI109_002528 [Kwoniella shandongensis]KAA5529187.1 hypothetical protein CI109_002528 [Kwoniella shandongensis]
MPTATRPRSSSTAVAPNAKKAKVEAPATAPSGTDKAVLGSIQIPSTEEVTAHRERYLKAEPYKYAAIGGLLSDELLEGVVEESRTFGVRGEEGSLPGWGWEQKETDIYKIQQTPDLSSLDPEHLPEETLAALPITTRLKNALYSEEFRSLVRQVTGCGPLSGKKKDLSTGLYTQGSHLLLHDDSISTRLISYILYLPNSPLDAPKTDAVELVPSANGRFLKGWDPAWGGSLELFPVENGDEVGPPGVKRTAKVDVKWGQIVFFEVQPGRSYHAVEEVVIGEGRQRLGVSGWFHRPVEGEEGHQPEDAEKAKQQLSSLAQITAAPSIPFTPLSADAPAGLTGSDMSFLGRFLAPSYLSASTLEKLAGQFGEASEIVLHNCLAPQVAAQLKKELEAVDKRDYPAGVTIPPQDLGEGDGYTIQGPSSKHRYLTLSGTTTLTPTFQSINEALFTSNAFRQWLSVVTSLVATGQRVEARRFRKGLDYTLANGEDKEGEAILDVSLGATWWADVPAGSDEEDALVEHGGWECYLAAPDEGEDPETYQSALARKAAQAEADDNDEEEKEADVPETDLAASSTAPAPVAVAEEEKKKDGPSISIGGQELEFDPDQFSPSDFDSDSDSEDGDDGPLLTQPVSFNKLLLVLRDPGVMKFVKYLSAGAPGSRWDVNAEMQVGMLEEDDDEDEEAADAQE